jgi:hypothetical protein
MILSKMQAMFLGVFRPKGFVIKTKTRNKQFSCKSFDNVALRGVCAIAQQSHSKTLLLKSVYAIKLATFLSS